MLAQQRGLVYVHRQAKHEGDPDADTQRLVYVPEHQHQRQKSGIQGTRPSGSMFSSSAAIRLDQMKTGLAGSSNC